MTPRQDAPCKPNYWWVPALITVVMFLVGQTVTAVWWAASITKTVESNTQERKSQIQLVETRFEGLRDKTESEITEIKKTLEKIDLKLDRLLTARSK